MERTVTEAIGSTLINNLSLLEADIKNCPNELWEKKYGGDIYWHQIYHTMVATFAMLQNEKTSKLRTDIPDSIGMLKGGEYSGDYSKERMLQFVEKTKKHLTTYFSYMSDSLFSNKVDFFGKNISILDLLLINVGHIMYHIGACDAALRDNGGQAAM